MDKTIGILAGMGPRSTAPFIDEVVTQIVGTGGTLQSGLYQQGLAEGGVPFTFDPQWQDALDALISGIKAGEQTPALEVQWRHLLSELEAEAHVP